MHNFKYNLEKELCNMRRHSSIKLNKLLCFVFFKHIITGVFYLFGWSRKGKRSGGYAEDPCVSWNVELWKDHGHLLPILIR